MTTTARIAIGVILFYHSELRRSSKRFAHRELLISKVDMCIFVETEASRFIVRTNAWR